MQRFASSVSLTSKEKEFCLDSWAVSVLVKFLWLSKSIYKTLYPSAFRLAPRFRAVTVLPCFTCSAFSVTNRYCFHLLCSLPFPIYLYIYIYICIYTPFPFMHLCTILTIFMHKILCYFFIKCPLALVFTGFVAIL